MKSFKIIFPFILGFLPFSALAAVPSTTVTPVPSVSVSTSASVSTGKCLSPQQLTAVETALKELQDIHSSVMTVDQKDPIKIVEDWDGRVYVNGGSTKPIQMRVQVGQYVDRTLDVTLKTEVYYAPKPPDPMFRSRVRAELGILLPQLTQTVSSGDNKYFDYWLALDFFHIDWFNVSVNAGVQSMSSGVGVDITKNFGLTTGYALTYSGFKSNIFFAGYFSFN